MAAGYDGSIKIDTNIDGKGFNTGMKQINKGLGGITKSLKSVAVAAGIAFSIKAIVDFGKESVKASTELSNAMIGLQSIMEGQGRSFNKAQEFITSYVEDGLIPATEAINSYKNLALRGYDDTQIQQVMKALKDSAAFGRQASYTLGKAVETATEGLKNENSILVDNAGVTKNVAKMWDDYAKSIGTTSNNLTKQQKIQAEVIGIMEETRFQVGDAAKVADSYSGQILKLQYNFNNLKIAVGNALIPIAQAVLPGINAIIEALTRLANVFAQVSNAIFGTNKKVTASTKAAAQAETDLTTATKGVGTATKNTNKELKKALANFDELNVLSTDTAESMADVGSGVGGIDSVDVDIETAGDGELFGNVTVNPKIKKFIDDLKESIAELSPYTNRLKDAWDNLKNKFEEFIESPGVQYILEYFKELSAEMIKRTFTSGILILTGLLEGLAGALDILAGLLMIVVGIFTGDFDMATEGAGKVVEGFGGILEALGTLIEAVLIFWLGEEAVEAIKTFTSEWKTRMINWWNDDVSPWFTRARWKRLWEDVKTGWRNEWTGIKTWWNNTTLVNWFREDVSPWFTKKKWVDIMKGVKDAFPETFKNAINSAIELFNRFIGWVNEKMKFSWGAISVAGKEIVPGGNIQLLNIPRIPKLATGAVIPPNSEFLAILGDQKSGTNIEAPLSTIEEALRNVLREWGGGQQSGNIHASFYFDAREFARVIAPYTQGENNRLGMKLINEVR